jgi:hypothetical protein
MTRIILMPNLSLRTALRALSAGVNQMEIPHADSLAATTR